MGLESANGIVYCEGSDYDHAGFTVDWDDSRWHADLAPDLGDDALRGPGTARTTTARTRPVPHAGRRPRSPVPADPDDPIDAGALPAPAGPDDLIDRLDDARIEVTDITDLELTDTWQGIFDEFPIEDLAPYEPQTTCSPSPKAGTYGFSQIVLDAFDSTGTSGIGRAATRAAAASTRRAGPGTGRPSSATADDAAAASQVIGWLLATDEHGNEYAMARRLGVMYIIYNQSIWRAYAPEQGWVGYTGPTPTPTTCTSASTGPAAWATPASGRWPTCPTSSAMDFGPYAFLPDAGGVAGTSGPAWRCAAGLEDRLRRPERREPRRGTRAATGAAGAGGGRTGRPPRHRRRPARRSRCRPCLPSRCPAASGHAAATAVLVGGGGGGGGGGLLPLCPPGTPLLPLPRRLPPPGGSDGEHHRSPPAGRRRRPRRSAIGLVRAPADGGSG